MVYKNNALDWMTRIRIGYDKSGSETNKGFEPEWHHYFPRSYINKEGINISKEEVNSFANIVVLAQEANRTISSNAPKEYISELGISNEMLKQQITPTHPLYRTAKYFRPFIKTRTKKLSQAMTDYFKHLA
jgi:hypothetical protein